MRPRSHESLVGHPDAMRHAREATEEPWLAPLLEAPCKMMRRLGAALALQEVIRRMLVVALVVLMLSGPPLGLSAPRAERRRVRV